MPKLKLRLQAGFSLVETLLLLITISLVAGVGYYVWHSQMNTSTATGTTTSSTQAVATAKATERLHFSDEPTYYDCMDAVDQTNTTLYDAQTGSCKFNTTGGQTYNYPSAYSDDMIRGSKGLDLTSSEAVQLRKVAQVAYNDCKQPPSFATVTLLGEARSQLLYYTVGCDGGYRELDYSANGTSWKSIYNGQDEMDCDTITKYHVPQNILDGGNDTQCYDTTTKSDLAISSLNI